MGGFKFLTCILFKSESVAPNSNAKLAFIVKSQ